MLGIEQAGQRLIIGGVMPLWLGARLADWHIRRRTRIQDIASRYPPGGGRGRAVGDPGGYF